MNTQEHIARLQATIRQQEAEVQRLEHEIVEIQREIAAFEVEYNRVVKPVEVRLQAVRDAINDLETLRLQKQRGSDATLETLWKSADTHTPPPPPINDDDSLDVAPVKPKDRNIKDLYRRLARMYHPDMADNEADRQHRNRLMAMINEAYAQQDFDALQALAETTQDISQSDDIQLPLNVLKMRKLQQYSADLAVRIMDLKAQHTELMHSPMMTLKIQWKLARIKGRDLLQEMFHDFQTEYETLLKKLDTLRNAID
ncbi:MAG: hypothetical protein CUN56_00805 [Phototrophicales bacterium]|nr:MAG: hypothetical protein CUN56_00805 [Phototrophicales bacterium]